jgi:hypothetical protein
VLGASQVSAQGTWSQKREEVLLNIFDREWVERRLGEDLAEKRRVLTWVRNVLSMADEGNLDLKRLPVYPGTELKFYDRATLEVANLVRPEPAVSPATPRSRRPAKSSNVFLVVERAKKDISVYLESGRTIRPAGTIAIGVHFSALPNRPENPIRRYVFLNGEISKCDSAVAQELFPPTSDTVSTTKAPNSHIKTYTWGIANRWRITVFPDSHFGLDNYSEKQL